VLALCDVPHAAAVVVLTNSDPANLEIALGARAMRADVPLVVRMEDARSRRPRPVCSGSRRSRRRADRARFAGLARFRNAGPRPDCRQGAHDRAALGGAGTQAQAGAVPLCAWRAGRGIVLIHSFEEIVAGDTVIYAIPPGVPVPEPGLSPPRPNKSPWRLPHLRR